VTKLADKITTSTSHRLIVSHLPLILVCIEGLGDLAAKFPMLAKQCADCLREFLTGPSRLLVRLNRHSSSNGQHQPGSNNKPLPQLLVTQSDSNHSVRQYRHHAQAAPVASATDTAKSAFERLRDCAIENLCRALKAQATLDQNSIPALVSAVTTRLFQPDNVRDKDWLLSSRNAILALGHIAVTLKEGGSEGTSTGGDENARAVLKFLLQWFDSTSVGGADVGGNVYDTLLVDQLGCIVISRGKNDLIYTEVLKKFKEIVREASLAAAAGWPAGTGGVISTSAISERKNKYQQCSGAVVNALANISAGILLEQDLAMDFLTRLMELYVNMGLEVKKKSDREPAHRAKSKGNLGKKCIIRATVCTYLANFPKDGNFK